MSRSTVPCNGVELAAGDRIGTGGGDRTHTPLAGPGILSPVRLPVSPPRRIQLARSWCGYRFILARRSRRQLRMCVSVERRLARMRRCCTPSSICSAASLRGRRPEPHWRGRRRSRSRHRRFQTEPRDREASEGSRTGGFEQSPRRRHPGRLKSTTNDQRRTKNQERPTKNDQRSTIYDSRSTVLR
jgi:hypothetical protein